MYLSAFYSFSIDSCPNWAKKGKKNRSPVCICVHGVGGVCALGACSPSLPFLFDVPTPLPPASLHQSNQPVFKPEEPQALDWSLEKITFKDTPKSADFVI